MAYEKPTVNRLGSLAEMTLTGCFMGKTLGGSDGTMFMGMSVPISNCGS